VQTGGSTAVGVLVERGVAYGDVFAAFAVGLCVLVVVLGGLRLAGRLPGTARGASSPPVPGRADDGAQLEAGGTPRDRDRP
jgi:hypothetical protein